MTMGSYASYSAVYITIHSVVHVTMDSLIQCRDVCPKTSVESRLKSKIVCGMKEPIARMRDPHPRLPYQLTAGKSHPFSGLSFLLGNTERLKMEHSC